MDDLGVMLMETAKRCLTVEAKNDQQFFLIPGPTLNHIGILNNDHMRIGVLVADIQLCRKT
jgi:hypothetical protein